MSVIVAVTGIIGLLFMGGQFLLALLNYIAKDKK